MKEVAVYGGAFDPPHVGHEAVIKALIEDKPFREVWITPSGVRDDKVYSVDTSTRYLLIKDFFNHIKPFSKNIKFCHIEINPNSNNINFQKFSKISGTYELMEALSLIYENYKFYFVIGSDLLADLPKWNNADKLKKYVHFLVLKREGFEIDVPEGFKITIIKHAKLPNISSSELRPFRRSKDIPK